jgi:hypothetical protein
MKDYFSKSCNKTSKKFYQDFDKLPKEIKALLWSQPNMPTFEDLRTAWELVESIPENQKLDLHVYEEERKVANKLEAERKREQKRKDRINARLKNRRIPVYDFQKVIHDPKQARLVQRVTEEEAVKLLATRKNNNDMKIIEPEPTYKRTFIGYRDEVVKNNPEVEIKYYDGEKQKLALSKQMHNA